MPVSRRCILAAGATLVASSRIPVQAEMIKRHQSDYFSFVGSDARGSVYLAHDNIRGQTGARFFADHWIMM